MTSAYLDTSALVKLVVAEAESVALDASLRAVAHRYTSIVGRIELERVARRQPDELEEPLGIVLDSLEVLPLHVANAAIAGIAAPPSLSTLDAIHLATLLELRDDIDSFYCYDDALSQAARSYDLDVRAPR